MLSVLIPVYNYDIRPLVNTLHEQLTSAQISFEIICIDDCSKADISSINSEIQQLAHTSYHVSSSNKGRVATRHALAVQASFDWLLFLDADVLPTSDTFVSNYLTYLTSDYDAVYGSFAYKKEAPQPDFVLRWTYGQSKEQVKADIRNKKPYKITISANFLIRTSVFKHINSKITYKGYGYDNYFGSLLKTEKSKICHIDNEVFHLGLESNTSYLNKVEQSVDTLLKLDNQGLINTTENSLIVVFRTLKQWRLNSLFSWLFKKFKSRLTSNLLSQKPSMLMLQLYKLSYICYQDLNS
ncbi:glycosyltransferase family 2 protein [Psychroserpens luteolus]|uniref:glycosyltransferase family 2 protein n=1 Tax=Psychroserpens luteolus TaxID=2855840 RepID=UPI001E4F99D9|nr:glycosyltransferase family 2 protein [Psychroserpens luteolus]MCD2260091.1 glycosyltransferase family 2 protein [Psychroserpens luteolus]